MSLDDEITKYERDLKIAEAAAVDAHEAAERVRDRVRTLEGRAGRTPRAKKQRSNITATNLATYTSHDSLLIVRSVVLSGEVVHRA